MSTGPLHRYPTTFRDASTIVVFGVATKILSNNPMRKAIIFSVANANRITLAPSASVTDGHGIMLPVASLPWMLTWDDDRELVCSEWWATTVVSNQTLACLEILYLGDFPRE